VSAEALLFAGYGAFLLMAAALLEWLSAHTHRRSLRYRTAGFTFNAELDHWVCPEGQHLWPHDFDHERRVVRYRAKAHICNGCPRKADCTDSDRGREITRPLDPWPHSEAGRYHRGLSLMLVALAGFVLAVGMIRNHAAAELAAPVALAVAAAFIARWLLRDLATHPANFPAPTPASGTRMPAEAAASAGRSRWATQRRTKGTPP